MSGPKNDNTIKGKIKKGLDGLRIAAKGTAAVVDTVQKRVRNDDSKSKFYDKEVEDAMDTRLKKGKK